jgi:hypothetical protein
MSLALVEGKYFRVYPITKVVGVRQDNSLVVETQDIKNGLAIEKKDKDGYYYVVAFVKPHFHKINSLDTETVVFADMSCGVALEDVDFRTIDIIDEGLPIEDCWEILQEYKNCVEFARNTLLDLQEKE